MYSANLWGSESLRDFRQLFVYASFGDGIILGLRQVCGRQVSVSCCVVVKYMMLARPRRPRGTSCGRPKKKIRQGSFLWAWNTAQETRLSEVRYAFCVCANISRGFV